MENLVGFLLFIIIIGGLMLLFSVYTRFLAKLSSKQLKKRLDSGKIDDAKLVKLYNTYKNRKTTN